ncbi:ImuA family protein [Labrys monachus]|uniref:Protein ImuA n=1 Tax=Labrys monachus TaxID=217067 RepID=A0ABU0FIN5_9HYPH|nr:ImuA protein [Labrys monachus]MDQ0394481.1 protein ImuA [Labrys monachus]
MPSPAPLVFDRERRAEKLAGLRLLLPKLEHMHADAGTLPFGIEAVDRKLPGGGLALDALHEIAPQTIFDSAGAFGFLISRLVQRQDTNAGTLWLVVSPRGLSGMGWPYGHGLRALGLDPARLVLVTAADETRAAWAMEEILRSGAAGAVAGLTGGGLEAAMSRRLQLAAAAAPCPLFLLRPPLAAAATAAVTRWRIGSAPGPRDRFGLLTAWRWRVQLERSRNGQNGSWLMEFDHATHRLGLAAALADPALPESAGRQVRVA